MRHLSSRAVVLLALFLLVPGGCAPLHQEILPVVHPGATYDELYPRYVDLCAVSQIRATFATHGGSPGHAVMWLKGVCRDEEAGYPRLKVCEPGTVNLDDPKAGTGVSVNKVLQNVNWLAIPGGDLFFLGNLKEDQVLDKEHVMETIADAVNKGVFEGVKAHEKYLPTGRSEEEAVRFLASETLGTDFALNFGRTSFCIRVPVNDLQLEEIVAYLNGLNDDYHDGEHDYNWSGYSDNCVHTVRNALAAADVWSPKSVRLVKFLQLFNMAIPSNEMVNLAFRSNTAPLEDLFQVYNDRQMRESLLKYDWLPVRHGALMTIIPVHEKNELYETGRRIFVLEGPFLTNKTKRVRRMYEDSRYTDLEANLRYYRERYESILADRPENWEETPEGDEFYVFRRKYYQYIESQLADVNEKLTQLGISP